MSTWQLSLRAERPVEGCEIGALAYLYQKSIKKKNGIPTEASLPPPPPSSEYTLHFRWLRGPEAPVCSFHECPIANDFSPIIWSGYARKSTHSVQCIDDSMKLRLGLYDKRKPAIFCCRDCFVKAWKYSSTTTQHTEQYRVNSNDGSGGGGDEASDEDSSTTVLRKPRSLSVEYSASSIATSSDNTEYALDEWIEVCNSKSFRPTTDDVGRRIRLECNVYNKSDGAHIFGPRSIKLEPVLGATPPPPKRSIATVKGAASGGGYRFRVISYNLLSEIYATQQMYPDCDVWALSWSYRFNNLMRDIRDANGDVVCLQEVQCDHFEKHVKPAMHDAGFDGIYKQKTRESMGIPGKVDGCAIFWRRSKFRLSENYSVEYNECARTLAQTVSESDDHEREILSRLLKDNIAQVIILEILHPNQSSNIRNRLHRNNSTMITIANTHLYSNKDYPDVKFWQCLTLVRELEQLVLQRDLPLIICGDFNSVPSSAVYDFLSTRQVSRDYLSELAALESLNILPQNDISHKMNLVSAYKHVLNDEPKFTNYTNGFIGVLDYIWCTSENIRPLAVVHMIKEDVIKQFGVALPNTQYSSDHILLCGDFQLGGSAAGQGGNATSHSPPPPMQGTDFPHLHNDSSSSRNGQKNKHNPRR